MKRQIYKLRAGNINRLKISTDHLPFPGPGQVQIKMQAIGLNFADVFAVLGLYSATPQGEFIPGLEYSGEIIEVGEGVDHYAPGQSVMGVTRFGAYASHINIGQEYVIPLPLNWTFQDGASYLVQVLTAYYGLKVLGDLNAKQTVLIHSAAGGVGIWANRICKKYNATTIGTVGQKSKIRFCMKENYDKVFVRNVGSFKQDLRSALNGRTLDIIMESIGGKILEMGYHVLAPTGRLIVFGSAHYGERKDRPDYFKLIPKYLNRPRIDPQNMIKENKSIMAFNLIYLFEKTQLMHQLLEELKVLDLGKPMIGEQYDFEDLPNAIRKFQSGLTVGKVVVNLDSKPLD